MKRLLFFATIVLLSACKDETEKTEMQQVIRQPIFFKNGIPLLKCHLLMK